MPRKGIQTLAEASPELANQWHPTKNGELTAFDVSSGSDRKVWWKCDKGDDHEWYASIYSRKKGGCPVCSNRLVVKSNCIASIYPELAKEWHPSKNGELTPENVAAISRKIWWKCDEGDDHEWKASIQNRLRGDKCPVCLNKVVVSSNSLAVTHPELAKEWHPSKNGELTPSEVVAGTGQKIWWKCDEGDGHEWQTAQRISNGKIKGCPFCSGHKVTFSTSLESQRPEIAKEWHPTKNQNKKPSEVAEYSHFFAWWKCDKGDDHEWQAYVLNRCRGTGCPFCKNKKTGSNNSVIHTHPHLIDEFHPTKNGRVKLENHVAGSTKKIWWKCNKGFDHEWITSIRKRTQRNHSCPFCTLTPQSKQELTITFELKSIFKEINPRGFKSSVEGKLWTIDIFIPSLNLGVEFDGNYWHKDKHDLDKLKTKKLQNAGFKIIRIREEPLQKINEIDIISPLPFDAKYLTNKVLVRIEKLYSVGNSIKSKIHDYLQKDQLQNESELETYIEAVLQKKAEKSPK